MININSKYTNNITKHNNIINIKIILFVIYAFHNDSKNKFYDLFIVNIFVKDKCKPKESVVAPKKSESNVRNINYWRIVLMKMKEQIKN